MAEQTVYSVVWVTAVSADSAEEAAAKAWKGRTKPVEAVPLDVYWDMQLSIPRHARVVLIGEDTK